MVHVNELVVNVSTNNPKKMDENNCPGLMDIPMIKRAITMAGIMKKIGNCMNGVQDQDNRYIDDEKKKKKN